MHALTRFRAFDYDEARVVRSLQAALQRPDRYVCLVAEAADGQLAGWLLAVLERHVFSDQLVASVMHYGVPPERRMGGWGVRLMKAFELWAASRQVEEIAFSVNSGHDTERIGAFARRLGYGAVGENFVKRVG
nr:GNAT family N-acetyltransferase [Ramlibacter aurantiacus]